MSAVVDFFALKRKLFDFCMQKASLAAVMVPLSFLLYTFFEVIITGSGALYKTEISVDIEEHCSIDIEPCLLKTIRGAAPELQLDNPYGVFSLSSVSKISNRDEPLTPGDKIWVAAATNLDSLKKNTDLCENHNVDLCRILDALEKEERTKFVFNSGIFTNGDSSEPMNAGILGVTVGSLMTTLVCLIVSVPIGIMGGICIAEFMPKNRLSELLQITINNLNATPPIIFGIIGVVLYINFIGIARSSPLSGGLTLAMVMVPMLIITTSRSIESIPHGIKEAALALGASKLQILFHHTLPYTMPYIVTNITLGIARIIGESAPLLLIGMVAFIADIPSSILEPATVFPTQIYIWSTNPEPGFRAITSITIIALLLVMLVLNLVASIFRKFFTHRSNFD